MGTEQAKDFDQITRMFEKTSTISSEYWYSYSNLTTWQFWILLALFFLPLAALYLFIDRKKALLLGFFGFSIHMLFHYIDTFGVMNRLWNYPYKLVPFMPMSLTLDTSVVPVFFMLLYQWTLNNNRNYYVYSTGACIFFAFLVKPAMVTFGLFQLYKGFNYFYLLLLYLVIAFVSKWITNLFVHFQKEGDNPLTRRFKLNRWFPTKEKAR